MSLKTICLTLISVILIFVIYFFLVTHFIKDNSNQGQFGDMFGAVNAFFSSLAFFGLLYSIVQQNQTIQQNSNQLIQTKREFDTESRIKALNTLITIYEKQKTRLTSDHLKKNELEKKILELTEELEKLLTH